MTTIKGKLDPFFETGTEGVIWSLFEDGKAGYDGLNILNQGDYLTIFDPENPTKVVWEGNVDLEYERNYVPFPQNPQYGQQAILGTWVHGIQRNVEPDDWGTWFFKAFPGEVIKSEIGQLYRCKSSTIEGYRWLGKGSKFNVDREPADLILKFKNSGYYRYKNVDYETYYGFQDGWSKGKYFAIHIKDKFVTEKLDLPRPAKYSLNKPKPWTTYPDTDESVSPGPWIFPTYETHGKPHGSDVAAAWPFPVFKKP